MYVPLVDDNGTNSTTPTRALKAHSLSTFHLVHNLTEIVSYPHASQTKAPTRTLDSLKRSKAFVTPEREPKNIPWQTGCTKTPVAATSTVAKTKETKVLEHQKNLPLAIYQNFKYDRRGHSKTIPKEFFDAALQIEDICISKGFWPINKIRAVLGISYEERLVSSFLSGSIKLKQKKIKVFSNVVQTKAMKTCIKNLSMEYDGDLDNYLLNALFT